MLVGGEGGEEEQSWRWRMLESGGGSEVVVCVCSERWTSRWVRAARSCEVARCSVKAGCR